MNATKRKCRFCGSSDIRDLEHVWPQWLNDVIPGQGGFAHRYGVSNRPLREHDARGLDVKVRRICYGCHHGWMNDLEGQAQPILTPMIEGTARSLSPEEQAILSRWICKTIVTTDLSMQEQRVPQEFASLFFADLSRPPEGTLIWLARYDADRTGIVQGTFALTDLVDTNDTEGFLSTFRIGHFCTQVFWSSETEEIEVSMPAERARALVPIRPTFEAVEWPPALAMNDESFDAFMKLRVQSGS